MIALLTSANIKLVDLFGHFIFIEFGVFSLLFLNDAVLRY